MNELLETLVIIVIAVTGFTLLYKILPFRTWQQKKPGFSLFPKYTAAFSIPVSTIESNLEKLKFNKVSANVYSRGKIYGDFSAKAIKLTVEIDSQRLRPLPCHTTRNAD